MRRNSSVILLVVCGVLFALGLIRLFQLRFETGDVYPAYSSLRADPLGTMAYYESLAKVPGLAVRRDLAATDRLPEDRGTVYLHLAAEPAEFRMFSPDNVREIKNFLARGGRLVITEQPRTTAPDRFDLDNERPLDRKAPRSKAKRDSTKKMKKGARNLFVNFDDEFGVRHGFEDLLQDGDVYQPVTVTNKSAAPFPATMRWHSGAVFKDCSPEWKVIYARGGNPVVMERIYGSGSLVLATDSYFVSNEAMVNERHSALLSWLIGSKTNVVFDEAHLGIVEQPGVATLMRKYRLEWLALGTFLLAVLFIWKSAVGLLPARARERREDFIAGKDSGSGFVNLLRRSVAPGELLRVCFAEWRKSMVSGGGAAPSRVRQADALFEAENARSPRERNAVQAYRRIAEALGSQKKRV